MVWLWSVLALAAEPAVDEAVRRELSIRDGFVGCEAIWASGPEEHVRDALLAASESQRPPWVPMRAADCLVERAGEDAIARERARAWLRDPKTPGLALVVVDNLDALPEPVAVELAELAVERIPTDARFGRYAPERLRRSEHPRVRALAGAPEE